ncbi:MAG: response regulator [Caulobacterales bacterium]|nr:response regulator [Caulobacterales bacterium]
MADRLVHIIDDDEAMRDSLVFLLDTAGLRVRASASAKAFLKTVPDPALGCVVTDIRMPDMTGLDLIRALKAAGHDYPVIVITGHADVALAVEAMKAGVIDFIEKPFDDETLLAAITIAFNRMATTSGAASPEREAIAGRLAELSPRERDVLRGVIDGKPNKVIAYDLGISPRTVEVYRANLMTKMQAASLSELVRMALVAGY